MSTTEQAVMQEIAAIVAEMRNAVIDASSPAFSETNLITQGELDSLDFINLLFRLEESYGVKIPEEEIDARELAVVKNLARYVVEAKS